MNMAMRTELLNSILKTLLAWVFIFALVACDPSAPDTRVAKNLARGLNADPESLDPHLFVSSEAADVLRDIGEGLLSYNASGELVGGAAEYWEVSQSGTLYKFRLRSGLTWSNGDPLTAHDYAESFRRLFDTGVASPSVSKFVPIKNAIGIIEGRLRQDSLGVSALSDRELKIELEAPTPYFLQLLAHPSAYPVHRPSIERYGREFTRPGNYVTNGAYQLSERIVGSTIGLQRNQKYWDNSETSFDSVTYFVESPATEVSRYRAGELDITASIDPALLDVVRREIPEEVYLAPTLGVYYYGFNLESSLFKDRKLLRRALSMAIDRAVIVDAITRRGEIQAFSLVPPGVANYGAQIPDYAGWTQKRRNNEARRLFAEAGYSPERPLTFELRYNTIGGHKNVALAIQSMWREVLGVEAVLRNEEFKVFLSNVLAMKETEAYRLSWTGDFNDAYTFLQLLESSNSNNLTGYSNKLVDLELSRAKIEANPASRQLHLETAERLAMEDQPVIPIYFFVSKHLVKKDIIGWEANVLDIHLSKNLARRTSGVY
jgi:oligopeptide transport system substrate-binding protein